jgi:PKD repeat protein
VAVLDAYTNGELGHQGGCHIGSNLETGKKQYKWLENDLAATDKPWKVILMHVSPLSCDCSINDDVRHDLEDLAKAQGVDLLISAHDHYYSRKEYNGIQHICLGGGGAALDGSSNSCKLAIYHYARFHVVNDGRLDVKVFKVDKDTGGVSEKDSFSISQTEPQTTTACFEASSYSHDYRLPTRFTCTSPGLHTRHNWDLGDGTHSTDENPYHSYPKPTNSSYADTYTVALTVSDDTGTWYVQTEKEVTVYILGRLQITVETEVIYPSEYAVFLRPRGVPLDEVRDFLGFYAEYPIFEVKPGDWTLTVRLLGYKEWEGDVTIKGNVWTEKKAYPEQESHPNATIAIGSVPTGADVTAVAGTGWGSQTVSGTTPFLVNVCCPGTEPDQEYECFLDYNVQTGGVTGKGVSDICTKYGESSCGVCLDGIKYIYLDLRPGGASGEDQGPLILRQPSDQEVVENGRAHLRISARSRDTLTYRWYEGISGDTSNPIYGGTGPIYITPELTEAKDYWVRVHDGYRESYVDSRTATVTVVNPDQGPQLTGALPPYAIPTSQVTLQGLRFDPGEYGENRVFFDEYEASVEWTTETECVVTAPYELETGESADLQIMVSGVWSNTIQMEVRDDLPILASGDYDGDGKSEIALFRPDTGLWAVRGLGRIYFGTDGDIPVSGDYNGDGYTDVSIFRPSTGLWAVKEVTRAYFGGSDDIPVPGDYDGDGSCDLAVLGRTSARWAVRGITRIYFGTSDNYPAPGDYDGDGSLDIAAFRPSSGLWAIRDISRCYFGTMSDVPVPGVYRWYGSSRAGGPFRSQIAVFRPSSGLWAIRQVSRFYFGTFGDKPLRGDFTGSSLDAIGIFRGSSGLWSIRGVTRVYYGTSGDTPVAR